MSSYRQGQKYAALRYFVEAAVSLHMRSAEGTQHSLSLCIRQRPHTFLTSETAPRNMCLRCLSD